MFGTIRRHQNWLLVVVAALTILSFVVFGPTNTRLGNALLGKGENRLGAINGHEIDQNQFKNARNEVLLGYLLQNNQWPDTDPKAAQSGFNLDRETYSRLMLIEKQKELGINVSTEAAAKLARQIPMVTPIESFEEKVLKPKGLDSGDLERFLRHSLGIQQMGAVVGLNGKLVTPKEAEELYRKDHEERTVAVAFFPASNYVAGVTASPEALAQFYSNRVANYIVPEKAQVNYVKWNVTNYLSQAQSQLATNLNTLVEQEYQRYGTNAAMLGKTPEEAKARLKEEFVRMQALGLARRAANEFAVDLDKLQPRQPGQFAEVAKQHGLEAKTSEPFDQVDGLSDWKASPAFLKTAFALTPEEPFSGALAAEDGFYVLGYNKHIPQQTPPLKSVEAKVTADYKFAQASQQAYRAGLDFSRQFTNGVPAGKTFAGMAADARAKVETVPPFSLSTRSLDGDIEQKVNLQTLREIAFTTPVGKVSSYPVATRERDGVFVLYVQSEAPVAEAQLKKELPDFIAYMRQARQNEAFNQWFNRQIQMDPEFYQILQKMNEQNPGARAPRRRAA